MTVAEFLKTQTDDTAKQLAGALRDFSDEHGDTKLSDQAMSPKETLGHLMEAYVAVQTILAGDKHEWGSYAVPDLPFSELVAAMMTLREESLEKAFAKGDAAAIDLISNYVVAHDYYHVGQLAMSRLGVEPNWDCYSIYGT